VESRRWPHPRTLWPNAYPIRRFEDVAAAVEGIPYMTPGQGRLVYDHLRSCGAQRVLELGTAHGVSSAYMAAALDAVPGGRVTSVDRFHFGGPQPEETIARAGLADRVELIRIPHSSYVWWLKEQIEQHSDDDGNCEPCFDFCYLDGAHDFTIDGLAVLLVERLLRPGGWLLLDDLDWTYDVSKFGIPEYLSPTERAAPHMRAVFDVILKPHPAFTSFRLQDGSWGWAQKAPGQPKRYRIETTRRFTDAMLDFLSRVRGRLLPRG